MQFACAPVLGALSDRFGRRPVLLVSLAGAAVDYAIMATAPFLWVLYIGRIVAGITGATGAVAGAYIADITDGDERARHFGFMSACFGFGMVAGPVLGGLMGGFSPRSVLRRGSLERPQFPDGLFPFAGVAQRRTPAVTPGGSQPARFVPVGPGHDRRRRPDGGLLHHATCRTGAGRALGHFRRGSLSLGRDHDRHFACRIWHSAFTRPGNDHRPCSRPARRKRALMLGMIADGTGYILLAFATRGWMAFPIMVLLASGGIGMPALQAMLSVQVDEERQGQLQGSLAALTSLTSIVGPLLFTAIYAASITTWNGWAWIAGAALYLLCLPALRRGLWSGAGGNEPIADRGNDRPMPCGSRRLPASYTRALGVRLERWPSQILPITSRTPMI